MGVIELMETQQKIFWQIADGLRGTALTDEQLVEVTLQLVVWEKLSFQGDLPDDICLKQEFADSPAQGAQAMAALAAVEGLIGEAFANTIAQDISSSGAKFGRLRDAIATLLRLRKSGMLERRWSADVFSGFVGRQGLETVPAEFADLMVALAECNRGESVYLPWDSSAQFAARVADLGCRPLVETPLRTPIPALISLLIGRPFPVCHSDPIREPAALEGGQLCKFDRVIAFPPFGIRYDTRVIDTDLWGRFPERTPSGTVLAISHVLAQAHGRCVVAVPNSFLFGAGVEATCRQRLLERGQVRAVIAMPGVLHATALPFAILVLDAGGGNDLVRFINGNDDLFRVAGSKTRVRLTDVELLAVQLSTRVKSSVMRELPLDQIAANDFNLEVGRYLRGRTAEQLQRKLETSETVRLHDVAEIVRPLPTLKEGEGIRVHEVGAADIPAFGYIATASREVAVDENLAWRNERQFLRPLDVVLVVKGSTGKVGIVPPDAPPPGEGGWIAGQSSIVLRCLAGGKLDAHSLALQLRSPIGQTLLKMITSGASIPLIQVRELQQMQLFASPPELADEPRQILEEEADIQRQIAELIARQSAIAAELWQLPA